MSNYHLCNQEYNSPRHQGNQLKEKVMSDPRNQAPHLAASADDQMPDFHSYRERAHQERTRAINMAMSMLWSRMTRRRSRQSRDAGFWTA
jgi:hypothetical protein